MVGAIKGVVQNRRRDYEPAGMYILARQFPGGRIQQRHLPLDEA